MRCKKESNTYKKRVKEKNASFIAGYKWQIAISCVVLVIAYITIYLCFLGDGFLPAGTALDKKDWLSFLGAYLSFAGTAIISLIAIFQGRFFTEQERKRISKERKRTIQPIFSIDITAYNSSIAGVAYAFNPYKLEALPVHKNVTITIENVGEYPIRNVIIFNQYLWQLLKPNEKKQIQVAYSDSPDIQQGKGHIIELIESDYERSAADIPMWFNINYDDIDGNEMFQTYELKNYGEKWYYSLEKNQDA